MASIDRRNGKWRVRWRDPDGRARSRSVSTRSTANGLRREIEAATELGRRWKPNGGTTPTLVDAAHEWLNWLERHKSPDTVKLRAVVVTLFAEFIGDARRAPELADLSVENLERFHDHLRRGRRVVVRPHRRDPKGSTRFYKCSTNTANQYVVMLRSFWLWAYERDEWRAAMNYPKSLALPDARPALEHAAPTWSDMDALIAELDPAVWYIQLFTIMRYLPLRSKQAMHLQWSDVDLDDQTLRIRAGLPGSKTKNERRGRVVPLSDALTDELAKWGTRDGWLVDKRRAGARRPTAHLDDRRLPSSAFKTYWSRTGVPAARWRMPTHSFRRGVISGLAELGVHEETRKYLAGHSGGVHGDVYTVYRALEGRLRDAVNQIPRIGETGEVVRLRRRGKN
jgi:integrase